jgi:hypothetical protein
MLSTIIREITMKRELYKITVSTIQWGAISVPAFGETPMEAMVAVERIIPYLKERDYGMTFVLMDTTNPGVVLALLYLIDKAYGDLCDRSDGADNVSDADFSDALEFYEETWNDIDDLCNECED